MRWCTAYATATAVGLFGQLPSTHSFAFVPQLEGRRGIRERVGDVVAAPSSSSLSKTPSATSLGAGGIGWDNDNFLEALSGGKKDMDKANEQYRSMSRHELSSDYIEEENKDAAAKAAADDEVGGDEGSVGAVLTDEMKAKVRASHTPEEEATQGGQMFQKLMERARQNQERMPPPPPPPPPPTPPQPAAQAAYGGGAMSPPADPSNLSVEEQARMFREMMQQQQQQPQQQPPYYSAPPPQPQVAARQPVGNPVAPDGRRIGRNRDADAIVNTSDVYLAQLKKDSFSRNMARYSGDDETANRVFADPSIKEIKMHVNPHLEAMRAKEKELLETSEDEMIFPEMFKPKETKPKSYTGVSYKEKLRQMKNRKDGGGAAAPAPAASEKPPVVQRQMEVPKEELASPPIPSVKEEETPVADATPQSAAPYAQPEPESPPVAAAPAAPVQDKYETWAQKLSVQEEPTRESPAFRDLEAGDSTTPSSASSEDLRSDLRTLMGLLVKHRGGQGFGAGRLQGNDIKRFEALAEQLSSELLEEAKQQSSDQVGDYPQSQLQSESQQPQQQASPSQPQQVATAPAPDYFGGTPSPAMDSSGVAPAPQGTVTSTAISQRPVTPPADRINGMMSCIEGAIQMYRNSPPEIQEGVLITLRAALLSAVNTCNDIIAQNEVRNFEAYRTATTDVRTSTARMEQQQQPREDQAASTTPATFYDVIPQAPAMETQQVAPVGGEIPPVPAAPNARPTTDTTDEEGDDDENTKFLQSVYDRLKTAAGDGKMGIKKDMSPEEAAQLAGDIADMRAILVDELQNGIPKATSN